MTHATTDSPPLPRRAGSSGLPNAVTVLVSSAVVWLCVVVLTVSLAQEPADCETWCPVDPTRDAVAVLALLIASSTCFVAVVVRFAANTWRSKVAWIGTVSAVAQVLVFLGLPYSPGWQ